MHEVVAQTKSVKHCNKINKIRAHSSNHSLGIKYTVYQMRNNHSSITIQQQLYEPLIYLFTPIYKFSLQLQHSQPQPSNTQVPQSMSKHVTAINIHI